jgi:hypothetical protein
VGDTVIETESADIEPGVGSQKPPVPGQCVSRRAARLDNDALAAVRV